MKTFLYILLGLLLIGVFAGTTWFLYQKSQKPVVTYQTAVPVMGDLEEVTVVAGTIMPRKEVAIKPQVPGILETIAVEAGQRVKKGDVLGQIRIVPNLLSLNEAENRLARAHIQYKDAQQEFTRQETLFKKQLISERDYKNFQVALQSAGVDLKTAENNLQLIKEGVAKQKSGGNNTLVTSTVDGMILDIPVKEGETVIETSSLNAGTTIAVVADMQALVFEGYLDEAEVGRLREGMELKLTIGAIQDRTFQAVLEYIAPQGKKEDDGAVQFRIKAAVTLTDEAQIRAGYSANGKIVLARKEHVLTLAERLILYDEKQKPYVEREVGVQQFEKRTLTVGLSDGLNAEIVAGLTLNDRVKDPQSASDAKKRSDE